jgi:tetratricopeptide (TPR) repeat protein
LPQSLKSGWDGPPPEPINAIDYFFIGLLNYFVAKRKETIVPRALFLLRRQFPDLDGKALAGRADRLLNTAIWLEPGNYWTHWVLGRNLLVKKEFTAAQTAFNAAIALRPDYARGYEQRALAIAEQWKKSRREHLRQWAFRDSDRARSVAKGDPSIFWPRGELFEKLGDLKQALHFYARWLELEQDIPSLISRSAGLDALERIMRKPAFWLASRSLRAAALAVRAHVRFVRGNYERAIKDANHALRLDPQQEHALTAKGMLLYHSKVDLKAALPLFKDAIEAASARGEINYRALFERANALQALSARNAALTAWRNLFEVSESSRGDRCPPWMLEEARQQETAINANEPLEEPA